MEGTSPLPISVVRLTRLDTWMSDGNKTKFRVHCIVARLGRVLVRVWDEQSGHAILAEILQGIKSLCMHALCMM